MVIDIEKSAMRRLVRLSKLSYFGKRKNVFKKQNDHGIYENN